jgi:hypothetical protein
LKEEYGYTIKSFFSEQEELGFTFYFCPKSKTLSLDIDEQQKAFILAKEIGL